MCSLLVFIKNASMGKNISKHLLTLRRFKILGSSLYSLCE